MGMNEREHATAVSGSPGKKTTPRETFLSVVEQDRLSPDPFLLLLYIINTPTELRGAMQVWRHLGEVLITIRKYFKTTLKAVGLAALIRPLRWIVRHPSPDALAAKIFPGINTKARTARKRFLQSVPPSPLCSSFSEHSLFSCLWTSHANERLQSRFRILQAHFLIAHARVICAQFPIEKWLRSEAPNHRFFQWLYEPGFQIRCFSEPRGEWDACLREAALSLLPLSCTVGDFPARLRSVAESISQAETFFLSEIFQEAKSLGYGRATVSAATEDADEPTAGDLDRYLVSSGLRRIASFLEWGLNPVERELRKGHGKGGNKKGGSKSVGGAGDVDVVHSVPPSSAHAVINEKPPEKADNTDQHDDERDVDEPRLYEIGIAVIESLPIGDQDDSTSDSTVLGVTLEWGGKA